MTNVLLGSCAVPDSYADGMTAQLMHAVGRCLHRLTDSDDFQWAACRIRDFFANHFRALNGLPQTPIFPRFLHSTDIGITPPFDASVFAGHMAALENSGRCATAADLIAGLKTILCAAERKILLWTYGACRAGSEELRAVLSCIRYANVRELHQALAVLLDEPVECIAWCLAPPCRLTGLGLMEADLADMPLRLSDFFQSTEKLDVLLETAHATPEAMLQRLLQPGPHWALASDGDVPGGMFYEWYPAPVADVLAAAVRRQTLDAQQIATAFEWLTGARLSVVDCVALVGRVDFMAVELAICRCFVVNGLRGAPVTVAALREALEAAVD
jgi:hypothetical protein